MFLDIYCIVYTCHCLSSCILVSQYPMLEGFYFQVWSWMFFFVCTCCVIYIYIKHFCSWYFDRYICMNFIVVIVPNSLYSFMAIIWVNVLFDFLHDSGWICFLDMFLIIEEFIFESIVGIYRVFIFCWYFGLCSLSLISLCALIHFICMGLLNSESSSSMVR